MNRIIDKIIDLELDRWSKMSSEKLAQHFYGGYKYKIIDNGVQFKLFFYIFQDEKNPDNLKLNLNCGENSFLKMTYYIPRGTSFNIKKPINFDREFEIFNIKLK